MEQQQPPNPNDDANNPPSDAKAGGNDRKKDKAKGSGQDQMPQAPKPKPGNWINLQWEKVKKWETSNKLSGLGIIVNVILIVFTFMLWKVAINSLKATSEQFEISNRPFIQCDNFKVQTFQEGGQLQVTYQIRNFGNYAAKIMSKKIMYQFASYIPSDTIFNGLVNATDSNAVEFFINKESPTIDFLPAQTQFLRKYSKKYLLVQILSSLEKSAIQPT